MSPMQCRAARALLDWTQPDLAEASGLSLTTVVDLRVGVGAFLPRLPTECERP